ncbi:hypothetical protein [Streptomyces adustus]|uniref:hypothetical protein n=1 Tax=Streptomyces adustus TaxID=1609272 RepID=UPI0037127115
MRAVWWGLWWLCLVFVVVIGGWFVWTLATVAGSDEPAGTVSAADCGTAMEFAGASMPAGADDEDCLSHSWGSQAYDGTFRMPRPAVAGWLATSFPGGERPAMCDADLCVTVFKDPDDKNTTGAYDVSVSVRYEGGAAGDTALVSFEASTY